MNSSVWVTQAIRDFGLSVGLNELQLDEDGTLMLEFETMGRLGFEELDEAVWMYLTRSVDVSDHEVMLRALERCQPDATSADWVQFSMLNEDQLSVSIRVAAREFHLSRIEDSISFLSETLDSVIQGE